MRDEKIFNILLPGWGIAKSEYAEVAADITVDYGFFGEKTTLDLMNPEKWISDLVPDKKYTLTAHSMGALFALRNSQLRDNAEAIYITGGFAKFAESDDNPYGKPAIEAAMMQKQLKRNPAALLKSFYRAVAAPEKIKIAVPEKMNTEQLKTGLELLKQCDIRKELNSIKVPVHIIHGKEDTIVSAKLAEYLHQHISGSTIEIIPDCGHALPLTMSVTGLFPFYRSS